MITGLHIQNFKCFQESPSFTFSKLNLLTGINGRGKSSMLQTLLILSQSARKAMDMKRLYINDELVELGNFEDIQNSETSREKPIQFTFNLTSDLFSEANLIYKENEKDAMLADLHEVIFTLLDKSSVTYNKLSNSDDKHILELSKIFKKIHYVSADRLGPLKYVEKMNLPEFLEVGVIGENCISILASSDQLPLVNEKLYRGKDANTVLQQAEEWLSYILDGAKIDIRGRGPESSILYMLLNSRKNSYTYKPTNVGFGYSYVLPLIVTGLIAKPGEILIIENPEAHLHPRAQSKITEFFAKVASCGVQIFIESHSEHILNSLRVCALMPEVEIANTDISILYFDESFLAKSLSVDEKGKIENWPNGFFDQQGIELSKIFRYSK